MHEAGTIEGGQSFHCPVLAVPGCAMIAHVLILDHLSSLVDVSMSDISREDILAPKTRSLGPRAIPNFGYAIAYVPELIMELLDTLIAARIVDVDCPVSGIARIGGIVQSDVYNRVSFICLLRAVSILCRLMHSSNGSGNLTLELPQLMFRLEYVDLPRMICCTIERRVGRTFCSLCLVESFYINFMTDM